MKTLLTAIAMATTLSASAGDLLTPETLWSMGRMGTVTASPDGKSIAYAVTHYNIAKNSSHTAIHTITADGGNHKKLTTGRNSESSPAFLPDGRLAYLSKGRLYVMYASGMNRIPISPEGVEIEAFKFSPDGKKVLLVKQIPYTESIEAKESDLPLSSGMVINDLNYKHWDQYVTTIPHIFVADVTATSIGEMTDILEGQPFECPMLPFGGDEQFSWSPDGTKVLYTCRKKTGVQYAISTDSDIFMYDLATKKTTNLCKPADYVAPAVDASITMKDQAVNHQNADFNVGYDVNPAYSPDGTKIAWQSRTNDGCESDRNRLCIYDVKTGEKRYVTESFDSDVDEFVWGKDSKTLYFVGVWHARSMVWRTDLEGKVEQITDGDYDYTGLTFCNDQLLTKRHSMSAPDDLYSLLYIGKKKAKTPAQVTQLTKVNDSIMSRLSFGEVKERWVKTKDGQNMLCWVIYPPHFDATKTYPTLLFCEGGPQSPVSQFWSYRWNFQIMAANGYIIIAPNRRGLPGFGSEWLNEISGDYTGLCMQDYKDAIDDLCRESYVDKDRLGCVGASFGGYSVYWLAGNHDHRFKCFIAHDGIYNTTAQYTETEEMWFENWDATGAPWRVPQAKYYTESPHTYIDRWDTPILCIHGEKDYRILASQGQSAFTAARLRGIPAQLLLYPDENHWVLKPQNGILWQRTFFRWLDKWLKPTASE